jgi:hypothetical protein
MLAQVLRPGGGNGNAGAAFRCRLTVNEATLLSGLPNRQAWARRPPGLKDFGVGPWVRADPFEEIEDEGVDSVGFRCRRWPGGPTARGHMVATI